MGERKVLNKYIPSDFDPSLVPRGKKLSSKDGTVPVRMMLPFSVQCTTCNTFLYRGRKFNSKKEPMGGPSGRYLGIQRWRFYIKCTHCSRPITFCTDPQNADYEMESGGTRNYEVHKDKEQTEEAVEKEKEEEEKIDSMKALENRVLDSQREMADLDNLEEIKAMNRRHIHLLSASGDGFDGDAKALLNRIEAKKNNSQQDNTDQDNNNNKGVELTEEDEALIKSIKFGQKQQEKNNKQASKKKIKRLDEEDERRLEEQREQEILRLEQMQKEIAKAATVQKEKKNGAFPIIKAKRKRPVATQSKEDIKKTKTESTQSTPKPNSCGLTSLLGDYGSDSDSD